MIVQTELRDSIQAAYLRAREDLLEARDERGVWTGRLSSSALSTATAISALAVAYQPHEPVFRRLVPAAIEWLARQQNADGGWGDTPLSHSNIATSMLVAAALRLAGDEQRHAAALARNRAYIEKQGGIDALRRRYGRDKTFAIPILTNAALAGQVPWDEVARLPFEAACLPQSWYRFLQLPVVSYAIPALVAVGQVVHQHRRPRLPLLGWLRDRSIDPSLRTLTRMQPASGGFLEAIPLTSFVAMSLARCGHRDHVVTQRCLEFLQATVRDDGSWPIDSDLATWNTTLALNALGGPCDRFAAAAHSDSIQWLLACQQQDVHAYTGAAPGGWGWSDLSGAVPDADDTPGALLALHAYCEANAADEQQRQASRAAAERGVQWLLGLQNRDGGWPTFCRGWGKLPFDRSGSDLTAHALRALLCWQQLAPDRVGRAVQRGWRYLARTQNQAGSWTPLWFGNQHHPREENTVYGTSKCLLAYRDAGRMTSAPAVAAVEWLVRNQNADGGWGGDGRASSVEETSLAVEALQGVPAANRSAACQEALTAGIDWLVTAVMSGQHCRCSPIGLYFAKLWYYESCYPLVFATSALRAVTGELSKGT